MSFSSPSPTTSTPAATATSPYPYDLTHLLTLPAYPLRVAELVTHLDWDCLLPPFVDGHELLCTLVGLADVFVGTDPRADVGPKHGGILHHGLAVLTPAGGAEAAVEAILPSLSSLAERLRALTHYRTERTEGDATGRRGALPWTCLQVLPPGTMACGPMQLDDSRKSWWGSENQVLLILVRGPADVEACVANLPALRQDMAPSNGILVAPSPGLDEASLDQLQRCLGGLRVQRSMPEPDSAVGLTEIVLEESPRAPDGSETLADRFGPASQLRTLQQERRPSPIPHLTEVLQQVHHCREQLGPLAADLFADKCLRWMRATSVAGYERDLRQQPLLGGALASATASQLSDKMLRLLHLLQVHPPRAGASVLVVCGSATIQEMLVLLLQRFTTGLEVRAVPSPLDEDTLPTGRPLLLVTRMSDLPRHRAWAPAPCHLLVALDGVRRQEQVATLRQAAQHLGVSVLAVFQRTGDFTEPGMREGWALSAQKPKELAPLTSSPYDAIIARALASLDVEGAASDFVTAYLASLGAAGSLIPSCRVLEGPEAPAFFADLLRQHMWSRPVDLEDAETVPADGKLVSGIPLSQPCLLTPGSRGIYAHCALPLRSGDRIRHVRVLGQPRISSQAARAALYLELQRLITCCVEGPTRRAESSLAVGPLTRSALPEDAAKSVHLFPRTCPSHFLNNSQWHDLLHVLPERRYDFYVTLIRCGPEIEVYTAKHGRFDDAFAHLAAGDGDRWPQQSLAVLTRKPLPVERMPTFTVYPGGDIRCPVEVAHWDRETLEGRRGRGSATPGLQEWAAQPTFLTAEEVQLCKTFQEFYWSLILRRPPGPGGVAPVMPDMADQDCYDPHMYLVVPMRGWALQESGSAEPAWMWDLDMPLMRECTRQERGVSLHAWIRSAHALLSPAAASVPGRPWKRVCTASNRSTGAPAEPDATEGMPSPFELIYQQARASDPSLPATHDMCSPAMGQVLSHLMLTTPHNFFLYRGGAFSPFLTPNSILSNTRKQMRTYREFVEGQGYHVPDSTATLPLVEAHLASVQSSILVPPAAGDAAAGVTVSHAPHTADLVMEACRVLPFSATFFRLCTIFPCIFYRIRSFTAVIEFAASLGVPHVITRNLYSALCVQSAMEPVNYERLEFLGDSFLKLAVSLDDYLGRPRANEEAMTVRRSHKVSNAYLAQVAKRVGIPGAIITEIYLPKHCKGPLLPWLSHGHCPWYVSPAKDLPRNMGTKTLADVLEAMIGACLVDGNEVVTYQLLLRLGLVKGVPDAFPPGRMEASIAPPPPSAQGCLEDAHVDSHRYQAKAHICLYAPSHTDRPYAVCIHTDAWDTMDRLQDRLGYHFRDPALLEEALTLSDGTRQQRNMERLEYLGDAVLDWILAKYMYVAFPRETPCSLTHLKHAAVNAESFNRFALALGLHNLLRARSTPFDVGLEAYLAHMSRVECYEHALEVTVTGPKQLGDAFEALAGAIFLDCGQDLDAVWRVLEPTMRVLFETHVHPDKIRLSPVMRLMLMLSDNGLDPCDYEFRTTGGDECALYIHGHFIAAGQGDGPVMMKRAVAQEALAVLHEVPNLRRYAQQLRAGAGKAAPSYAEEEDR